VWFFFIFFFFTTTATTDSWFNYTLHCGSIQQCYYYFIYIQSKGVLDLCIGDNTTEFESIFELEVSLQLAVES